MPDLINPSPDIAQARPRDSRRRPPWLIPVIVAFAIVTITAGTAIGLTLAGDGRQSRNATVPPTESVECVNVARAYNAWNSHGLPKTAGDFATLNDLTGRMRSDDAKKFLDAVSGYADSASKRLAVAIAEYNVELGFVNIDLSFSDKVTSDHASSAAAAADRVHRSYQDFRAATCS